MDKLLETRMREELAKHAPGSLRHTEMHLYIEATKAVGLHGPQEITVIVTSILMGLISTCKAFSPPGDGDTSH